MVTYKTPMLQQYQSIKEQYPDCLLFFRLGDFYELFGDDAKIGSEVLHLTLTARDKGSDGKIPMCGVPFHASENYVARLVKAGYKVAICEQVSEKGKGLVEREVVRVVTAGTLLRDESITDAGSQYIVSLSITPKTIGGAAADLSTGEFMTFSFNGTAQQIIPLIMSHFSPRECIVSRSTYDNPALISLIRTERATNITCVHDWLIYIKDAESLLTSHFKVTHLDTFGLNKKPEAVKGAAALLGYLRYTQKSKVEHITSISEFHLTGHIILDPTTLRHLEIIRTSEGDISGSLFGTLNKTVTAAGQRLLQDWLLHPTTNRVELFARHAAVSQLQLNTDQLRQIRETMGSLGDIERLVGRLSVGLGSPRDLCRLADTIWHYSTEILPRIPHEKSARLKDLSQPIDTNLNSWVEHARIVLFEEAKPTLDEGYIFQEGFDPELDSLRQLTHGNKSWLSEFEAAERQRTAIPKLKVVYSRAFGYAIEVTKIHKEKVPADYVPRQTLVNAERYTCQALVEYEQKAITAMDRMIALEKRLFSQEVQSVVSLSSIISQTAHRIAELDVLSNFAHIAQLNHYVCPTIAEDVGIHIKEGRHPVIEQIDEISFVANDTKLTSKQSFQLITGPNMAGKSTYIRQVALIVLMAHTGCFIPVKEATIGITDRIFTRIGAHDNLREAQSTFMVEMIETAHILHNATARSLIILDEVGRGTSPEDGFALAWAIAESLADEQKGLVLFATHFHALKDIAQTHFRVFNSHLSVSVDKNDLIFLRKVVDGPTDESFGIVVAEKAGIPAPIISRAKQLALDPPVKEKIGVRKTSSAQLALLTPAPFPNLIEEKLSTVNINSTTPLEALALLDELQKNLTS